MITVFDTFTINGRGRVIAVKMDKASYEVIRVGCTLIQNDKKWVIRKIQKNDFLLRYNQYYLIEPDSAPNLGQIRCKEADMNEALS